MKFDSKAMYNEMANIPQLARGIVWCKKCGRSQNVKVGQCLRTGWPLCCDETMTVDSPEERIELAKKANADNGGATP